MATVNVAGTQTPINMVGTPYQNGIKGIVAQYQKAATTANTTIVPADGLDAKFMIFIADATIL